MTKIVIKLHNCDVTVHAAAPADPAAAAPAPDTDGDRPPFGFTRPVDPVDPDVT